jgi:hypothetical protein
MSPDSRSAKTRGWLAMWASSGFASGTRMTSMRKSAEASGSSSGTVPMHPSSSSGPHPGGAGVVDVDVVRVARILQQGVGVRAPAGLDRRHLHRVVQVGDVEDADAAEALRVHRTGCPSVPQSMRPFMASTDMKRRFRRPRGHPGRPGRAPRSAAGGSPGPKCRRRSSRRSCRRRPGRPGRPCRSSRAPGFPRSRDRRTLRARGRGDELHVEDGRLGIHPSGAQADPGSLESHAVPGAWAREGDGAASRATVTARVPARVMPRARVREPVGKTRVMRFLGMGWSRTRNGGDPAGARWAPADRDRGIRGRRRRACPAFVRSRCADPSRRGRRTGTSRPPARRRRSRRAPAP